MNLGYLSITESQTEIECHLTTGPRSFSIVHGYLETQTIMGSSCSSIDVQCRTICLLVRLILSLRSSHSCLYAL